MNPELNEPRFAPIPLRHRSRRFRPDRTCGPGSWPCLSLRRLRSRRLTRPAIGPISGQEHSPNPIPQILGLTGIIRICFELPGLSGDQDHAPPNNARPRHLAHEELMPVAFEIMGEFEFRTLRNPDVSDRFAAVRRGSLRQTEALCERRDADFPGLRRFCGDRMPTAGKGVRSSSDCPRAAIRTGTNRAGIGFGPAPEHGSRPDPCRSWRSLQTAEVDSDGAFVQGRQVPVP